MNAVFILLILVSFVIIIYKQYYRIKRLELEHDHLSKRLERAQNLITRHRLNKNK